MEASNPQTISFAVECGKCTLLSEDLTVCSNCGNNFAESLTENSGIFEPIQTRKRETNPFGIYLKEQKRKIQEINSLRKLDLKFEIKKWATLPEVEKLKYKQLSKDDRSSLEVVKRKKGDLFKKNECKIVKKKGDAKRMAGKRKIGDVWKKDVECSRTLLQDMLSDKKEALAVLNNEIIDYDTELERLESERIVTEKIKGAKKLKLSAIKKEYKDLFSKYKP